MQLLYFLFFTINLPVISGRNFSNNTYNYFPVSSEIISIVKKIIIDYFNTWEIIFLQDTCEVQILDKLLTDDIVRFNLNLQHNKSSVLFISFNPAIRRYSQNTLVVSFLTDRSKSIAILKNLEENMLNAFPAHVKKDEDYFLFLVKKDIKLVLNSEVGQRLKFKLAIPLQPDLKISSKVTSFTMCFYCSPGGKPKLIKIDLNNLSSSEASVPVTHLFPDFTKNGNGFSMRTSSPVKYKFTTEIREVSPGKWELVRGISKKIMDGVLPHHNYTYKVFSSPNGDTGLQGKDGKWNGCIGQILHGDAELSLTTSANPSRYLYIGFSTAAFYAWASFSTGQPKIKYSWKAIFKPFALDLWLAIIVTVGVVCCLFKLFQRFEYSWYKIKVGLYRDLITQISFSILGLGVDEPVSTFSRVLLGWWLLVALIFNTLYNSKIVSLLAMPVYEMPPKTFEELASSQTFRWGMDAAGGSLYALFETSNSPTFKKIFQKLQRPKGTIGCFQEAIDSNFACITWAGVADYMSYRNFTIVDGKSPIVRATDIVSFVPCALAMKRHAVFKPTFDKTISMLYDAGIGNRWIQDDLEELQINYLKWQREEMNRTVLRYDASGPDMLKLDNILGVYYIYAVGHALSVIAFIFEKRQLWQKKKNQSQNKN